MEYIVSENNSNLQSPISVAALSLSSPNDANSIVLQQQQTQEEEMSQLSLLADVISSLPDGKKPKVVKSILKRYSAYPKALSADDLPPVRMAENGKYKHFTKDKHGRIIPYLQSFWFANERYKQHSRRAVINHLLLKQKRLRRSDQQRLLVVPPQGHNDNNTDKTTANITNNNSDK